MVISFEILVTETVQLSRAVLLVNAECYTAWNTRLVGMQQYSIKGLSPVAYYLPFKLKVSLSGAN